MSASYESKDGISRVLGNTGTSNAVRVAELLAKARAKSTMSTQGLQSGAKRTPNEAKSDRRSADYDSDRGEDKYDDTEPLLRQGGGGGGGRSLSKTMKPPSRGNESDDEGSDLLSKTAGANDFKGARR